MSLIHGKAAQQSRRKLGELHGRCRERVVAADRTVCEDKHERRRDVLAGFLSGLCSKIAIEQFGAACEGAAIVFRPENLDSYAFERVRRESDTTHRAIAAHSVAKAIVDGPRIEQRFDKGHAVADRELKLLVLLDRAPRRILDAGQDEISDRPALQRCGPLDQVLLFGGHAGLEPLRTGAAML